VWIPYIQLLKAFTLQSAVTLIVTGADKYKNILQWDDFSLQRCDDEVSRLSTGLAPNHTGGSFIRWLVVHALYTSKPARHTQKDTYHTNLEASSSVVATEWLLFADW
jgi:hypothetical protein